MSLTPCLLPELLRHGWGSEARHTQTHTQSQSIHPPPYAYSSMKYCSTSHLSMLWACRSGILCTWSWSTTKHKSGLMTTKGQTELAVTWLLLEGLPSWSLVWTFQFCCFRPLPVTSHSAASPPGVSPCYNGKSNMADASRELQASWLSDSVSLSATLLLCFEVFY